MTLATVFGTGYRHLLLLGKRQASARMAKFGYIIPRVPFRTNGSSLPFSTSRCAQQGQSVVPSAVRRHSPIASLATTSSPDTPLNHSSASDSDTSFLKYVHELLARKATRKIISAFEEAETGEGPWGLASIKPSAVAFNTAIRGLVKATRPDLAVALYRLRVEARKNRPLEIPADLTLAASVVRSVMRYSKKRNEKAIESGFVFSDMLAEYDTVLNNSTEDVTCDEVSRMCRAFASLVSAFHQGMDRRSSSRREKEDRAMQSFQCFMELSKHGTKAALSVKEYNDLIRILGKSRMLDSVFKILDIMKDCAVEKDNETFEFIANATVRQVDFVTGAVDMASLPDPLPVEVAFVGRSNVGKSSLVNMICNRKALAYVSNRPGKTQQFNYFLVNERDGDQQFYFADLPGVGYAKVPKVLQEEWLRFMKQFFRYRVSLQLVFHLIDSRHGPLADDETLMREMSVLAGGFAYVIVLTKMDKNDKQKVRQSILDSTRSALERNGCSPNLPIVMTSATSKLGRDEMWRHLQKALKPLMPDRR